jgi:hypothetical protein
MNKLLRLLARLTSRIHRWQISALLFGTVPIEQLGPDMGRFLYACLMGRDTRLVRAVAARAIHREVDRSLEINLWLAQLAWYLQRPELTLLIYRRTERLFAGHKDAAIAASQRRFIEALTSDKIASDFAGAVQELFPEHTERPVILTLVSSRLFEVFRIWLDQVRRHINGKLVVMALDRKAAADLGESVPDSAVIDVSSWLIFDERGYMNLFCSKNLWILRVLLLQALVAQHHDVTSLDVDAFVLDDPGRMMEKFPPADIVAQKDYSIPVDVARRLGFIICCGFMRVRSNDRTIDFLNRYSRRTALEMDDQLAINHMIAEAGITSRRKEELFLSFESMGVSWVCPADSLVSRDIRYGSVIRHFSLSGLTAADIERSVGVTPGQATDGV